MPLIYLFTIKDYRKNKNLRLSSDFVSEWEPFSLITGDSETRTERSHLYTKKKLLLTKVIKSRD